MNYTQRLNKLINESGMTQKEIAEECIAMNEKVTSSYINVLKKNEGRIPSDTVSKAIAIACKSQYPDILVIQAYLDKAPEIIKNYLMSIMGMMKESMKACVKDGNMKEQMQGITEEQIDEIFSEDTLAEFICGSKDNFGSYNADLFASGFAQIQERIEDEKDVKEFKVSSDGKYLLVPIKENSTIKILSDTELK